jgi:hypothetical protein
MRADLSFCPAGSAAGTAPQVVGAITHGVIAWGPRFERVAL